MNLPWIESPFFDEIIYSQMLTPEQEKLATKYHANGFIILENVFPHQLLDEVKTDMKRPVFKSKIRKTGRAQDMWIKSNSVKELACNSVILDTLQMLYGRAPIPFQTLNFIKGTQQRAHADSIHFSSLPARFMSGVWVALEDISEEQGPIFYYPGSHKLPEYTYADINPSAKDPVASDYVSYEDFIEKLMDAKGFSKKTFVAKKGDVLIWSSNLVHGGSPVLNNESTRFSQVTHYYFEDCIYYTPQFSNMVTNELYIRHWTRDIRTGIKVEQSYNKKSLSQVQMDKRKYLLNNRLSTKRIAFFDRLRLNKASKR